MKLEYNILRTYVYQMLKYIHFYIQAWFAKHNYHINLVSWIYLVGESQSIFHSKNMSTNLYVSEIFTQ